MCKTVLYLKVGGSTELVYNPILMEKEIVFRDKGLKSVGGSLTFIYKYLYGVFYMP